VLGKVTRTAVPADGRADHILLCAGAERPDLTGYAAVLADGGPPEDFGRIPAVHAHEPLQDLSDGDVLFIEPQRGTITVLYEKQSRHNAILVTEACNCECVICPQPPRPATEDRTDFCKRLIQLMAPGPVSLALTGGEPTLLGDNLFALVEECRNRLPDTDLVILTNGRRFSDRRYVEKLVRVRHPRLLLAVALYAETEAVHDRIVGASGAFQETVRGLHNLALYRLPIELRVVISALNCTRLTQLVDFMFWNMPFVVHVALMGLEPIGLARKNLSTVWADPYDYRDELERACRFLWRRTVPVSIYNHPLCILPESLRPLARRSISEWKNIYLPVCEACAQKSDCCGLFQSAVTKHSSHITPIK
jgi:His-Xaa-Ser system radical SAM maturase HxsC